MSEKEGKLYPRPPRVRHETLRQLLNGLRALVEDGCNILDVTIMQANVGDAVRARAIRLARTPPPDTRKQQPKKSGRPRVHRQKPTETDREYNARLARGRKQRQRARDKTKGK